ncbi:MAG: hypothetical protein LCH88_09105 [Proteobacteria bacterium]|nr:hypothetical protein [Pseudomonadota bacterium]
MSHQLNRIMHKGRPRSRLPKIGGARPFKVLDATKPLRAAPEAREWLVAMVEPRAEEKAATALREAGYLAWYPQMTCWISSARLRTRTKVNRPLFPRYVFVALQAHARKAIKDCDHVAGIVGSGRVFARPSLLATLSRRQRLGEFDMGLGETLFARGDVVTVAEGVASGLHGVVLKAEADRVKVLMDLLGSKRPIDMPASALRKVA